MILVLAVLVGCGGSANPSSDSGACEPLDPSTYPLNMEMRRVPTPFTRIVYSCQQECTREQFDAIVTPEGWEKNTPNRILSAENSITLFTLDGVPSHVDFIEEIPGPEWTLIATVDGIEFDTGVPVAAVRRSTVFTFPACNRLHTLTDTRGRVFGLFAVIDDLFLAGLDIQSADAFADRQWPVGWTYDSYVLEANLIVDSGGLATVYNHRGESTWQVLP